MHCRSGGFSPNSPAAALCVVRSQESGLKVKEFELLRRNFSETGNFGVHRRSEAVDERVARSAAHRLPATPRRLWHQRAHRPGSEVRSVDGHLRCVVGASSPCGALWGVRVTRRAAALDKLIAYWRSTAVRASCVWNRCQSARKRNCALQVPLGCQRLGGRLGCQHSSVVLGRIPLLPPRRLPDGKFPQAWTFTSCWSARATASPAAAAAATRSATSTS